MKKRILSLFVCVCMLASMFPAMISSAATVQVIVDGVYYIRNKSTGAYVSHANSTAFQNVHLDDFDGSDNQKWTISTYYSYGIAQFKILRAVGKNLTPLDTTVSEQVITMPENNAYDGSTGIGLPAGGSSCYYIDSSGNYYGYPISLTYTASDSQSFFLVNAEKTQVKECYIRNKATGDYLSHAGASSFMDVHMESYTGGNDQKWVISQQHDPNGGAFTVLNAYGKSLTPLYTVPGTSSQPLSLMANPDETVGIGLWYSMSSCYYVTSGADYYGYPISLTYDGSDNQSFYLEPCSKFGGYDLLWSGWTDSTSDIDTLFPTQEKYYKLDATRDEMMADLRDPGLNYLLITTYGGSDTITLFENGSLTTADLDTIPDGELSHIKLAIIVASFTSAGFSQKLHEKGVETVVCFSQHLHDGPATTWGRTFVDRLIQGDTVGQAGTYAVNYVVNAYWNDYEGQGINNPMKSMVILGNADQIISE